MSGGQLHSFDQQVSLIQSQGNATRNQVHASTDKHRDSMKACAKDLRRVSLTKSSENGSLGPYSTKYAFSSNQP